MSNSLARTSRDESFQVRLDCPYEFLSHLETQIPEWDTVFRRHVKTAALAVYGYSPDYISQIVNYGKSHVVGILKDYNHRGFYALLDNRRRYDPQELGQLLRRTAQCIGWELEREHFQMWFGSAHSLPSTTSHQYEVGASTSEPEEYVETEATYTSDYSPDSLNLGWGPFIAFMVLLLGLFGIATSANRKNEPAPSNVPKNQVVPFQPSNASNQQFVPLSPMKMP